MEDIITRRIKDTGSFIFLDRYKENVEKEVDKYLKAYEKQFASAMSKVVRDATEDIIDRLYKGSAMEEFIDKRKLAKYVLDTIADKCKEG